MMAHIPSDSGAVSSLISENLVAGPGLKIVPTTRRITVADETVPNTWAPVDRISILFGYWKVDMDFLVMIDLVSDAINGLPAMKELRTCINLGNQRVSVQFRGIIVEMAPGFFKSVRTEELRNANSEDVTYSCDS